MLSKSTSIQDIKILLALEKILRRIDRRQTYRQRTLSTPVNFPLLIVPSQNRVTSSCCLAGDKLGLTHSSLRTILHNLLALSLYSYQLTLLLLSTNSLNYSFSLRTLKRFTHYFLVCWKRTHLSTSCQLSYCWKLTH